MQQDSSGLAIEDAVNEDEINTVTNVYRETLDLSFDNVRSSPLIETPSEILLQIVSHLSKNEFSIVSRITKKLRDRLQRLLFKDYAVDLDLEKLGFTKFLRTIVESSKLDSMWRAR